MDVNFYLEGKIVNPPVNWDDIQIVCSWTNNTIQPNIVSENFKFVNESAESIINWVTAGTGVGAGIFQGMDFSLQAVDPVDGSKVVFKGILDFLKGYKILHPNIVEVGITRPQDISNVNKKLEGLTFGFLYDNNLIEENKIDTIKYVVEPFDSVNLQISILLTEVIIVLQVYTITSNLQKDLADLAGVFTTAAGILKIVIDSLFLIIAVAAMYKYIVEYFKLVFPPPRKQKAITLSNYMKIMFGYLGYTYEGTIAEIDTIKYIPSQVATGKRDKRPIPSTSDFGYKASEMLQLVLDLFNAQIQIIDDKVYIKPEGDNWWWRNSKYKLPSLLLEEYTYNIEEAYSTQFFTFNTDYQDAWTIENFDGTNCQVNLSSTIDIPQQSRLLKGYREVRWPVALGSSSKKYGKLSSFINKSLSVFANTIQKIIKSFPTPDTINKDVLMVDTLNWQVPKLVVTEGQLLSPDNRRILNAEYLYTNFHKHRSFTGNYGQKVRYTNVIIPFGLKDYNALLDSAYFTTDTGELGKFERLEWTLGKQQARVTFVVYRKYVTNLKETIING